MSNKKVEKIKWMSVDEGKKVVADLDTTNFIKKAINSIITYFATRDIKFGIDSNLRKIYIKIINKNANESSLKKLEELITENEGFKLFTVKIHFLSNEDFKFLVIKY